MIDDCRTPSPNFPHIRGIIHTHPGPHPRLQYRVISKFIMNRPPTDTAEAVLVFVVNVVATRSGFSEVNPSPASSTAELVLVHRLLVPFAEVQKESSGHHPRDTARVRYLALLDIN